MQREQAMNHHKTIRLWRLALLSLLTATLFHLGARGNEDLRLAKALSNTYASIAEKARNGVVYVKSVHTVEQGDGQSMPRMPRNQEEFFRRFFGPGFPGMPNQPRSQKKKYRVPSQGSGFIIDAQGHVLTNNHVIQRAKEITVVLRDKREFKAEIVGRDPKSDVALLKILKPTGKLPIIKLADSDQVRVGELVMAIGAPFGLSQTVTTGIISAKGRVVGLAAYENFLQTDAAINPGNSGGPLINLDGEVIGINTAITSRGAAQSAGVGFAIPSNMAKRIMEQLLTHGEVTRGWIGVGIEDIDPEMKEHFGGYSGKGGVLITQVGPSMPADKAGMKAGDIILRFGDTDVKDAQHLRHLVANATVDKPVKLLVLRKGRKKNLTITPAKQPKKLSLSGDAKSDEDLDEDVEEEISESFGFKVQPLAPEMAEQLGYKDRKGVLVREVDPDSPAAEKGLAPGMLIVEVGQQAVPNVKAFGQVMQRHAEKQSILLRVLLRDSARYIVIKRVEKEEEDED